jgi:beta-glucanase (GH16 family)
MQIDLTSNLLEGRAAVWEEHWDASWHERWTPYEGAGGFGNQELQTYTSRPENILAGSGEPSTAVFTARSDPVNNSFTSCKLTSKRTLQTNSFYLEILLTKGSPWERGVWPAVWMLPQQEGMNWPRGGEIDIFEAFGPRGKTIKPVMAMCAHWADWTTSEGHSHTDLERSLDKPLVVGLAGTENRLTWYVDRVPQKSLTVPRLGHGVRGGGFTDFAHFGLIMNIALGGTATEHQTPKQGQYEMAIGPVRVWDVPPGGWQAFEDHHAHEKQGGRSY